MHEANRCRLEGSNATLFRNGPAVKARTSQAAIDGIAGQLRVDAAMHDFGDIVQSKPELDAQFPHKVFLDRVEANGQPVRGVRAIGGRRPLLPSADRRSADAKPGGKLCDRSRALLNVSPHLWRWREGLHA